MFDIGYGAREMERAVTGLVLMGLVGLALGALVQPSHEREVYHGAVRGGGCAAVEEADPSEWARRAYSALEARLAQRVATQPARNVVMFLGDGMSVPTLAAARTLLGQRAGDTGEEHQLHFETFPTVGLVKTYCVDAQVADSACSSTAYLCGAKGNSGTLGVGGEVRRGDCAHHQQRAHHVSSLAAWALADHRDAGIVTTTRVTYASPAGAFAHSADRDWESDADVQSACAQYEEPPADIAHQLVHHHPGERLKVILGGGRREFLPESVVDEEGTQGRRLDGRNLIDEWQQDKRARNVTYRYVWNREQLMAEAADPPEYLLGLFEGSHMQYHMQADPATEPTLAELTEVAIRSLSRNERGFFLFVEGGRIDHAHHENFAHMALDETIELSEAVRRATRLLSPDDSLVLVTSDHAHVMSLSGYPARGADIVGPAGALGDDGAPYMTLSYANGPGFRTHAAPGVRRDPTEQDYHASEFRQEALVPLGSETHGGDDVAVFAWGAHHQLFTGLYEQSELPHRAGYGACLGPGPRLCGAA